MKIAVIFSGQGAQKPGMGKSFYDENSTARAVLDSVPADLLDKCFNGTAEELARTEITQPAVYSINCAGAAALNAALAQKGLEVSMVAGFSLGEYSALEFAGVFDFAAGLSIVQNRGRWMAEAAGDNSSSMVAVMGDLALITEAVNSASAYGMILPVNYNCPGQTVVAGDNAALAAFGPIATELGLKVIPLKVSGAFHSPKMAGVYSKLKELLSGMSLHSPRIPVYSNVTGKPIDANNLPECISQQVQSPVRWEDTIRNMMADGADIFIEVGVGSTLAKFMRRIDRSVKAVAVEDVNGLTALINEL